MVLACLLALACVIAFAAARPGVSRATNSAANKTSTALPTSFQSLATESAKGKPEFVPGEILVRFRKDSAAIKETRTAMSVIESGRQIPLQVDRLSNGPKIVEGLRLARVAPEDTAADVDDHGLFNAWITGEKTILQV